MKSYYIYLIRNGITDERYNGRYIGHTDIELSDKGRQELEALKNEYDYPYAEVVFSSPLKRCTETAHILYPDKKLLETEGLIEYNFGEFEGKTAEELKDYPVFPDWLAGTGVEAPFGESDASFGKRITECFEKMVDGLIRTGITTAAVITHGGVISAILEAYGLPEAAKHEWIMENGSGFALRVNPSLWMRCRKIEVFAQVPFLPETDEDDEY